MTASPRIRLFSAPDLPSFRRAIADCLDWNRPWDLRASMVLVASRAAAGQLRWTLEQRLLARRAALVLPPLVTRDGLHGELHRRLDGAPPRLGAVERLVCGRAAAGEARASGAEPPFNLRPGLVDELLGLYDELRRNRREVDAFERVLVETLEPSRDLDRGARRMLRQTRFLAAMFRAYERRVAASGRIDEHGVRASALARGLRRPVPQVVLTVADRASGHEGLWPGDFDLLARLPGLVRLDVVSTSSLLAAGYRERLADLLPGIEETAVPPAPGARARLVAPDPAPGRRYFTWRDREEELLAVARQVKSRPADERTAVVFQRPLPYLYAARHLFASAGVPWEATGTLPLASEPFAAAIDLVLSFVSSGQARRPTVELLRSPHFRFFDADGPLDPSAIPALDRALREARYVGRDGDEGGDGADGPLRRLAVRWAGGDGRARRAPAARAARAAAAAGDELAALARRGPASALIDCLLRFVDAHRPPPPDDAEIASRESRARGAVLGILRDWRDAHVRHDDPVVDAAAITSTLRRLLEAATFAAPAGGADAAAVAGAALSTPALPLPAAPTLRLPLPAAPTLPLPLPAAPAPPMPLSLVPASCSSMRRPPGTAPSTISAWWVSWTASGPISLAPARCTPRRSCTGSDGRARPTGSGRPAPPSATCWGRRPVASRCPPSPSRTTRWWRGRRCSRTSPTRTSRSASSLRPAAG